MSHGASTLRYKCDGCGCIIPAKMPIVRRVVYYSDHKEYKKFAKRTTGHYCWECGKERVDALLADGRKPGMPASADGRTSQSRRTPHESSQMWVGGLTEAELYAAADLAQLRVTIRHREPTRTRVSLCRLRDGKLYARYNTSSGRLATPYVCWHGENAFLTAIYEINPQAIVTWHAWWEKSKETDHPPKPKYLTCKCPREEGEHGIVI